MADSDQAAESSNSKARQQPHLLLLHRHLPDVYQSAEAVQINPPEHCNSYNGVIGMKTNEHHETKKFAHR